MQTCPVYGEKGQKNESTRIVIPRKIPCINQESALHNVKRDEKERKAFVVNIVIFNKRLVPFAKLVSELPYCSGCSDPGHFMLRQ